MAPPHPTSRGRRPLMALFTVTAVVLIAALGLTLWNLDQLRERRHPRRILNARLDTITMESLSAALSPQRREHLRACYKNPEAIDLDKISWNLLCRPAPFLGYAPVPGRQAEGEFNAHQLRDARPLRLPKPDGVYRVFLIGGSLAYSVGAPDQESMISSYLERMLNEREVWPGRRVEVFNAGVCGWASTHERICIENRLSEWEPDLVIALTGANDAHWGFEGHNVLDFRGYEDEMYFALINGAIRGAGVEPLAAAPPQRSDDPVAPELVARRFVKNARLSALALQAVGARYMLALQPALSPLTKPLSSGETQWLEDHEFPGKVQYLAECHAPIKRMLIERGGLSTHSPDSARGESFAGPLATNPSNMDVLEIGNVFKNRADPIYFDLFHMGDKGNEILAQGLVEQIKLAVDAGP